ncbi:MAG: DNA-3-methyladenine glycosylase [Patescibacteria group bacterium]|nr:DNA-3-methyladenine glycosylase [Patescibacteria group bacterium]
MPKLIRLKKKFYQQNTFKLAKALLGKFLIRKIGKKILMGKIVEVEAYYGFQDKASHASRGKTERNKIMFGHPGVAYIYMIYGMYYCLNIITEEKNFPAAILIRALEPLDCHPEHSRRVAICKNYGSAMLTMTRGATNGPGKLCRALKIDKKLNGENLITSKKLYLAQNPKIKIKNSQITSAERIGIDYAGKYKHKPWRFYIKDNKYISKK